MKSTHLNVLQSFTVTLPCNYCLTLTSVVLPKQAHGQEFLQTQPRIPSNPVNQARTSHCWQGDHKEPQGKGRISSGKTLMRQNLTNTLQTDNKKRLPQPWPANIKCQKSQQPSVTPSNVLSNSSEFIKYANAILKTLKSLCFSGYCTKCRLGD